MADQTELIVKIAGDVSDLKKSLKETQQGADGLGDSLKAVGGAISFGVLVSTITGVVDKFAEAELASERLKLSLQNQGIFSKELQQSYLDTANALQAKTGVDNDSIVRGQALLQSFVGQREISKELTKAVLDLSAAQGIDLEQAFNLVGKSIGSNTNALSRYGIEVDTNASKQDKMKQIIENINVRWKDQAEVVGGTLSGQLKITHALFDDFQKLLGSKFAPIVAQVNKALQSFFQALEDNPGLVDLIAGVIGATAALAGAVSVVYALKTAFTLLGGATGIGLVITAVGFLATHWSDALIYIQSITEAFSENVSNILKGIGSLFEGIFTFDTEKIAEGFDQLKTGFTEGWADFKATKDALYAQDDADREAIEAEKDARDTERNNTRYQEKTAYEQMVADYSRQINDKILQDKAKNDATYLADQKKFGTAYAAINYAMHSEVYQGNKQAFGELAALQQSSNETLKGIGKVAAIANIVIKTAESAMNVYAGFSTIPIIGPALGTAAAAAVVAFGAEQIGKVNAAADGGLLQGGIPGVDSIPVLAQRGELISPAQNFEEVVGSVAATRAAKDQGLLPENGGAPGGGSNTYIFNGDVLADDVYIDRFIEKVTDRVEFGNARLLASGSV